jgi:hypothetical protein
LVVDTTVAGRVVPPTPIRIAAHQPNAEVVKDMMTAIMKKLRLIVLTHSAPMVMSRILLSALSRGHLVVDLLLRAVIAARRLVSQEQRAIRLSTR